MSDREATKQRLLRFCELYCPENIAAIDTVLDDNAGNYDDMFEGLVTMYGPEPAAPAAEQPVAAEKPASPAAAADSDAEREAAKKRLLRFCKLYCPENIENMDTALDDSNGDYEAMFAGLVDMFGPEPPAEKKEEKPKEIAPEAAEKQATSADATSAKNDPEREAAKERLHRFCKLYCPENIENMDTALDDSNGDYEAMFAGLVDMFGPEPAAPAPPAPAPAEEEQKKSSNEQQAAAPAVETAPKETQETTKESAAAAGDPEREAAKVRLLRFCKLYCPENIENMDTALDDNKDDYEGMFAGLVGMFGPEPPAEEEKEKKADAGEEQVQHPAPAAEKTEVADPEREAAKERLLRFCTLYCPENIENMDTALDDNKGNYEEMFAGLVSMFGPEPPAPEQKKEEEQEEKKLPPKAEAPAKNVEEPIKEPQHWTSDAATENAAEKVAVVAASSADNDTSLTSPVTVAAVVSPTNEEPTLPAAGASKDEAESGGQLAPSPSTQFGAAVVIQQWWRGVLEWLREPTAAAAAEQQQQRDVQFAADVITQDNNNDEQDNIYASWEEAHETTTNDNAPQQLNENGAGNVPPSSATKKGDENQNQQAEPSKPPTAQQMQQRRNRSKSIANLVKHLGSEEGQEVKEELQIQKFMIPTDGSYQSSVTDTEGLMGLSNESHRRLAEMLQKREQRHRRDADQEEADARMMRDPNAIPEDDAVDLGTDHDIERDHIMRTEKAARKRIEWMFRKAEAELGPDARLPPAVVAIKTTQHDKIKRLERERVLILLQDTLHHKHKEQDKDNMTNATTNANTSHHKAEGQGHNSIQRFLANRHRQQPAEGNKDKEETETYAQQKETQLKNRTMRLLRVGYEEQSPPFAADPEMHIEQGNIVPSSVQKMNFDPTHNKNCVNRPYTVHPGGAASGRSAATATGGTNRAVIVSVGGAGFQHQHQQHTHGHGGNSNNNHNINKHQIKYRDLTSRKIINSNSSINANNISSSDQQDNHSSHSGRHHHQTSRDTTNTNNTSNSSHAVAEINNEMDELNKAWEQQEKAARENKVLTNFYTKGYGTASASSSSRSRGFLKDNTSAPQLPSPPRQQQQQSTLNNYHERKMQMLRDRDGNRNRSGPGGGEQKEQSDRPAQHISEYHRHQLVGASLGLDTYSNFAAKQRAAYQQQHESVNLTTSPQSSANTRGGAVIRVGGNVINSPNRNISIKTGPGHQQKQQQQPQSIAADNATNKAATNTHLDNVLHVKKMETIRQQNELANKRRVAELEELYGGAGGDLDHASSSINKFGDLYASPLNQASHQSVPMQQHYAGFRR